MLSFVAVAKANEVKPGVVKGFQLKGRYIAVYNLAGKFYATNNICQHEGGLLHEGELTADVIMCPLHGWEYNVKTGECLTAPGADIRVFPVRVVGDEIQLALD